MAAFYLLAPLLYSSIAFQIASTSGRIIASKGRTPSSEPSVTLAEEIVHSSGYSRVLTAALLAMSTVVLFLLLLAHIAEKVRNMLQ